MSNEKPLYFLNHQSVQLVLEHFEKHEKTVVSLQRATWSFFYYRALEKNYHFSLYYHRSQDRIAMYIAIERKEH